MEFKFDPKQQYQLEAIAAVVDLFEGLPVQVERAEEEDEGARLARKKMQQEADRYLELIEQALKGKQVVENLFSIRWRVVA